MLDVQAQLFTDARTHYGWLDQPVDDATLQKIYELARWPPTGNNGSTMRVVYAKSAEAKEKLRPALFPMNVEKAMTAPVTALIAYDATWWTHMPYLTGKQSDQYMAMTQERRDYLGHYNAVLGAAYMIIAARSLGLDCGPMGGFDRAIADAAFFPDGAWRSILLLSVGRGDPAKMRPRMPRLSFETACRIA